MAKTTTKKQGRAKTTAKASAKTVAKGATKATVKAQNQAAALVSLNKWNKGAAILYILQGLFILTLSNAANIAVTASYLTPDPLASSGGNTVLVRASRGLFDINLVYLIGAFFFVAALVRILVATRYRARYEEGIKKESNTARWIELGLSGGLMMVTVALVCGVSDLASLAMIFVLCEIAAMVGLLLEAKQRTWITYSIGAKAVLLPWLVVGGYLLAANVYGGGHLSKYVYWIFGSLLALFIAANANMYLLSKKKGRWAEYIFGERVYMLLGVVAKAAVAWIIFFGFLHS